MIYSADGQMKALAKAAAGKHVYTYAPAQAEYNMWTGSLDETWEAVRQAGEKKRSDVAGKLKRQLTANIDKLRQDLRKTGSDGVDYKETIIRSTRPIRSWGRRSP